MSAISKDQEPIKNDRSIFQSPWIPVLLNALTIFPLLFIREEILIFFTGNIPHGDQNDILNFASIFILVSFTGAHIAYIFHKNEKQNNPIIHPVLLDMIDDYNKSLLWHRMFSFISLFAGVGCAGIGCYLIWQKIQRHFSDPDLASILSTTQDIVFTSVLYQWIPYISLIFILNGIALFFGNTYRRHSEISVYCKNRISSLKFMSIFINDKYNKDLAKEIIRSFDESHKPQYILHLISAIKQKSKEEHEIDKSLADKILNSSTSIASNITKK